MLCKTNELHWWKSKNLKRILIFTFSKKHTNIFMMKNRKNGIHSNNSNTPYIEMNFLTLKKKASVMNIAEACW